MNTSATNFNSLIQGNAVAALTESLALFPNPTTDRVNLRYSAVEEGDYTISIVDVVGKEVLMQKANFTLGDNTLDMNTENFASGLYLVKVSNENQSLTTKLLIQK